MLYHLTLEDAIAAGNKRYKSFTVAKGLKSFKLLEGIHLSPIGGTLIYIQGENCEVSIPHVTPAESIEVFEPAIEEIPAPSAPEPDTLAKQVAKLQEQLVNLTERVVLLEKAAQEKAPIELVKLPPSPVIIATNELIEECRLWSIEQLHVREGEMPAFTGHASFDEILDKCMIEHIKQIHFDGKTGEAANAAESNNGSEVVPDPNAAEAEKPCVGKDGGKPRKVSPATIATDQEEPLDDEWILPARQFDDESTEAPELDMEEPEQEPAFRKHPKQIKVGKPKEEPIIKANADAGSQPYVPVPSPIQRRVKDDHPLLANLSPEIRAKTHIVPKIPREEMQKAIDRAKFLNKNR